MEDGKWLQSAQINERYINRLLTREETWFKPHQTSTNIEKYFFRSFAMQKNFFLMYFVSGQYEYDNVDWMTMWKLVQSFNGDCNESMLNPMNNVARIAVCRSEERDFHSHTRSWPSSPRAIASHSPVVFKASASTLDAPTDLRRLNQLCSQPRSSEHYSKLEKWKTRMNVEKFLRDSPRTWSTFTSRIVKLLFKERLKRNSSCGQGVQRW